MSSVNKAFIIGNLTHDPECRYLKNGDMVANFTVATNETWKDKSGKLNEKAEFHRIVAWKSQARFAQEYFRKGNLVLIEGKIQTRDWTDKDNVRHLQTEIVAFNVMSLERRPVEQRGPAPEGHKYSSGEEDIDDTEGLPF